MTIVGLPHCDNPARSISYTIPPISYIRAPDRRDGRGKFVFLPHKIDVR